MVHPALRYCSALVGLFAWTLSSWGKLSPEQIAQLPPPASHPIRFNEDVRPILEQSCMKCHGRGKSKGDFSIESREAILKASDSGPSIVVSNSAASYLIELVSGLNADEIMPVKGTKLTKEQVGIMRAWIDQGLVWDPGVSLGRKTAVHLVARKPAVPEVSGANHPLDRWMAEYFRNHSMASPALVDDRTFARRTSLDVTGLLPDPDALQKFLEDSRPTAEKRQAWVTRLLADNTAYASHWLTFWNDLLRNDYEGTGFIDDGRKQISDWLYTALATNKRYDRLVADLVHPVPGTEGFTKGIVWRGAVNASQTPQMQAAQNISQVFLGVNLKCASCHDSFINDWSLADAYGMASIYADEPLEMVECDKPTGKKVGAKFLFSQLGSIPSDGPKTNRTQQLAQLLTSKDNGRFSRTVVNRLWNQLMGRGIVEPVDDMEQPAWNEDMLDWLAEDFVEHQFDLKHTLRQIMTSKAYQMPAVDLGEQKDAKFVFHGPAIRRLSAEQFQDALSSITGVWNARPRTDVNLGAGASLEFLSRATVPGNARWIWSAAGAATNAAAGETYFRKVITLPSAPSEALAVIAADNRFKLFINGQEVASGGDYKRPNFAQIQFHLKPGQNLIAVEVTNDSLKPDEKTKVMPPNPAGLVAYLRIRVGDEVFDVTTDASWLCVSQKPGDWRKLDFGVTEWKPAVEVAPLSSPVWNVAAGLNRSLANGLYHDRIRASLITANPLSTALGRPNREQVNTTRPTVATTLQALELSNGQTLARVLAHGAEKLDRDPNVRNPDLVRSLYWKALGRNPNDKELILANEVLGEPRTKDQVKDLLWIVAMLPEFQLIY